MLAKRRSHIAISRRLKCVAVAARAAPGSCKPPSTPHVPRIQAPRHPDIRRAFDDRPPIRKNGHLIGPVRNRSANSLARTSPSGSSAACELRQIERPRALVDLHRIAPAQAHRRAAAAVQVHEIARPAGRAIRVRRGLRDLPDRRRSTHPPSSGARSHQSIRPARIFSASAVCSAAITAVMEFSTPAVSQVGCAPAGRIGIHAAQARRPSRNHRHSQAVAAHGSAVDPRNRAARARNR